MNKMQIHLMNVNNNSYSFVKVSPLTLSQRAATPEKQGVQQ
ncbi:MAG: hypothetical protein ACJAYR_003195 [Sneathiella sp.]|jgi:hypothetical protein